MTKVVDRILDHPLLPVLFIVPLSLWASIPFYLLRFGTLSGAETGPLESWTVYVITLPLPGIVAAVYGWFAKKEIRAFLVGLLPYLPLAPLGIPLILLVGPAMGLMGAGAAYLRDGKPLGLLLAVGLFWWVIVAVATYGGLR